LKKNPKDLKLLSKKPNTIMLKIKKKKKTKRKSPSPTLGGTIDHFENTIQKTKGQETSTSDP
jgi:hypothetical protein